MSDRPADREALKAKLEEMIAEADKAIADPWTDKQGQLEGWESRAGALRDVLALLDAPAGPDPKLLAIAGLVNAYHNDATMLTAQETVRAVADVLGKPMERLDAPAGSSAETVCAICKRSVVSWAGTETEKS